MPLTKFCCAIVYWELVRLSFGVCVGGFPTEPHSQTRVLLSRCLATASLSFATALSVVPFDGTKLRQKFHKVNMQICTLPTSFEQYLCSMNYSGIGEITSAKVLKEIDSVVENYGLDTKLRLAHFLAQCHHESMGFKKLEENMNYSANRLLQVFPKYFDRFSANTFARKPKDIANIVYGGRMGNVEPNDGWDFRGRGYIHLTGRRNYELFGGSIGVDLTDNPQLVSKNYPMDSAAWFWVTNKIDELSDNGTVAQITRRVNGGVNGLKEREALFRKYLSLIK